MFLGASFEKSVRYFFPYFSRLLGVLGVDLGRIMAIIREGASVESVLRECYGNEMSLREIFFLFASLLEENVRES